MSVEKRQFQLWDGECTVTYKVSDEIKEQILNRIIKYCEETKTDCGEGLHQCDNSLIEAPSVLSDIIDNILEMETHENE